MYVNKKSLPEQKSVRACIDSLVQAGARVFLVGGAVRDIFLERPSKDIDIEIHNLPQETVSALLKEHFGNAINFVGSSFGVFKLRVGKGADAQEIDWSLPRTDASGRRPEVTIDPAMGIETALRRRDLTINAMAIDLATYELQDPFGGLQDLKNKVLRCPDESLFVEDPLRFYRVMQFIARFEMVPDAALNKLCATMDISKVSIERIEQEIKKMLLQAKNPSLGLRWLHKLGNGRLQQVFPELAATVGVRQSPQWHPEGDVFEHTMQVVDAAATLREQCATEEEKLVLMYAALCHDLGKPSSTQFRSDGKITSYGHDEAGVQPTKTLLARLCTNKKIIKTVAKLTLCHMRPSAFIKQGAKAAAYRRLALQLAPETNLKMLALLCEADKRGRNGASHQPLPGPAHAADQFAQQAEELGVLYGPQEAVLKGSDLLDAVAPGPKLGELVKHAYQLQINKGIVDKAELKKRVLG